MKYFTRGWANGEHDDTETSKMREAYWRRVEELRDQMPAAVLRLATGASLHDALIEYVAWSPSTTQLELQLICATDPEQYYDLNIRYRDVGLSENNLDILARCARDRRTEVLYDEVDRTEEGAWVHRILLWPMGEVAIHFSSLDLRQTARSDRRWDRSGCDPFRVLE